MLHKVGEDETMQQNEGRLTTKGATGSTSAGGKMAEDMRIDAKKHDKQQRVPRKKGCTSTNKLGMYKADGSVKGCVRHHVCIFGG